MKFIGRVAGWILILAVAAAVRAERWNTTHGESIEAELSAVYGPLVVLINKQGLRLMSVEFLDDAALIRVADFLARSASNPAWKDSNSKIAKAVRGRLQVYRDGKLIDFDLATRREPEFYLAYFGAHWCGPCREFSPRLVEAYERLKQRAPDRFEVIYVSSDRDGREMLDYVREAKMPWPLIKYSDIGFVTPIERWKGDGIPCLVVLTRDGDLLFNSYRGEEFLGPDDPLQKFEALLEASGKPSPKVRRTMHRLAMAQHVRAANGGTRPAKPYLVSMDPAHYQTLSEKELVVTLEIDERGAVISATVSPSLPAALNYQFETDVGSWLFLPAIEEGKPQRAKVRLPLKL